MFGINVSIGEIYETKKFWHVKEALRKTKI